jgi:ABC-type uncharacterized transport system auxiliary subunit
MSKERLFRTAYVLLTLSMAMIPSCSLIKRDLPTRQYYIINYTPQSAVPNGSRRPYPYSLHIGRFEVQRIFNRQNIMYRFSPNRIQYYDYERWAVRPDYMISDMIFKHFEATRLTNRVALEFLDSRPDFRLEGTVEALEKYDAGDLFYAHMAMTFKLLRVADGQQVWDYSFDERRRVYSQEMVYTVSGLSAVLQANMDTIVGQLDSLFNSYQGGIPWAQEVDSPNIPAPAVPAPSDSTSSGIDESGFEIIPDRS